MSARSTGGGGTRWLQPGEEFGLYVHVPFCLRHCPYCDFTVAVVRDIPHRAYVDALLAELVMCAPEMEGRGLASVYLGGGTPGLLAPEEVGRFLSVVAERWGLPAEVTLEMNPECACPERLAAFRAAGVTRLSFGVQSFSTDVLGVLGRSHDGEAAESALRAALDAGYARLSLDLIHGVPGQGIGEIEGDLEVLSRLRGVDHVSAYELTWEPRTAFMSRLGRGVLRRTPSDELMTLESCLRGGLCALGYERYEVSSHGRSGARSVHNEGYWEGREVLALGVGAHGLRVEGGRAVRRAGERSLRRYLEAAEAGRPAEVVEEELGWGVHLSEVLMTGVRTVAGLRWEVLEARFGEEVRGVVTPLFERWSARGEGVLGTAGYAPVPASLDWADGLGIEAMEYLDNERGG